MDLGAVKEAPAPVLARGAVAAARNAQDLLQDARMLAEAGRTARACSRAALAGEEAGKAGNLALLTVMPADVRARAPVGRMLEWHQLKLVGGLLIGRVRLPVAARLAVMPAGDLEGRGRRSQRSASCSGRTRPTCWSIVQPPRQLSSHKPWPAR